MPAATVDHSQRICEVWACNLDEEMKKIRQVIRKYNYVAMVFNENNFVNDLPTEDHQEHTSNVTSWVSYSLH
uniref:CCR4-NOT transcription complex subunit 7 n=1 Tax=Bos mutus grunniens TaxID=30521 RepID=A0A8B9X8E5_BOSMU